MTKPEIQDRARATAAQQHRERRWYRRILHRICCLFGKHRDILKIRRSCHPNCSVCKPTMWECKYCGRRA